MRRACHAVAVAALTLCIGSGIAGDPGGFALGFVGLLLSLFAAEGGK